MPVAAAVSVETPVGPALLTVLGGPARAPGPLLVLGHGAGGGTGSADLLAARDAALGLGWRVALVEQPWRVKGRRVAEAPPRLDLAWTAVLAELDGSPLVVGGRSAGARVACRTCELVGADAVLCLAFPLHPPGRPEKTRLAELQAVRLPLVVVQGSRDAFGVPPGAVVVPGADHAFAVRRADPDPLPAVGDAVRAFLQALT